MLTLKAVRETALYKALMKIPGVELMEIDKELQAVSASDVPSCTLDGCTLAGAFLFFQAPQGGYFWLELSDAQCSYHGVPPFGVIPCV